MARVLQQLRRASTAAASEASCLTEGTRFGPFIIGRRLGKGHFGTVHEAVHCSSLEPVAIKVERLDASSRRPPKLPVEAAVYRDLEAAPGFARLRWFGRAHGHLALVIDRLGPSLRTAHRMAGMRLELGDVGSVAEQTLQRLEEMHSRGWLHGDLKPANLLLPAAAAGLRAGRDAAEVASRERIAEGLFCIDFGLSRGWAEPPLPPQHSPPPSSPPSPPSAPPPSPRRRGPTGTVRFASVANHEGEPLGRRDDLEALAYMLVFLRTGKLPWSELKAPTKPERFARMLDCKRVTTAAELGAGFASPTAFAEYMRGVRALRRLDRPDYAGFRGLLREACAR